ncbi:MAG: hypothetical protein ACI8RZ_002760 [Myxococcota bacterium]
MELPVPLSWSPTDLATAGFLLTAALAYTLRFYIGRAAKPTPSALFRQRLIGAGFLGLLPLLADLLWLPGSPGEHGLALGSAAIGAPAVAMLYAILAPILFVACRHPMQLALYPQIRLPAAQWDGRLLAANAATWALYLLAYEWLFRGFLLFPLVAAWGLWPGMAVMIGLYVLVHLDKAPSEALSCFPMGVVFGLLAVETGGIFWPWVLHVCIAVGSEMFCLLAKRRDQLLHPSE